MYLALTIAYRNSLSFVFQQVTELVRDEIDDLPATPCLMVFGVCDFFMLLY